MNMARTGYLATTDSFTLFSHDDDDDDDEDDPFKNDESDDDDDEDDPFNCGETDEEIIHKKKLPDQHKNIKISQKAGSVPQLNISADKDNDANKSKEKTSKKGNNSAVEIIDWSKAYQTCEGTCVKEDMRKVIVTRVPTSYISPREYTIEAFDRCRCNHCQFISCTWRVKKHIRLNHRDITNMYQCPYCPYKKKMKDSVKLHIICSHKSESELEWFRCGECDFKAKTKIHLRNHILTHMQPHQIMDRMKKCDQCLKMFKTSYGLSEHIKYVHEKHKIKKLKCTECDYECRVPSRLKNHKVWHSDFEALETLKCPDCPYKTKMKHRLTIHIWQRHKQKFQCDKCAYTTDTMDKIKLHSITHKEVIDEADMKFRCDKCPYKTYRQYSLSVHKLNHLKPEEIQYFYCYHCQFKAKRKDNLKTHVLRHFKQNEVPFQCLICDFTTKTRNLLNRHVDKHSKERENQQSKSVVLKKKPKIRKNSKTKVSSRAKQLKGKKKSENDVSPYIEGPLKEEKVLKEENYNPKDIKTPMFEFIPIAKQKKEIIIAKTE